MLSLSVCCQCVSIFGRKWSPLNNPYFREKTSVGISSKNTFSSETKTLAVSIPRAVGWASQKMFGWVFVRSEKRFHLEIETADYRNSILAKIWIAFCTIVMCKPILCLSWNCRGVDYSHFFQFPPPQFQKFQISCKSPFTNAPNAKNLCTTGSACQKQQKLPGLRQIANTACSHTWYLSLFYITAIWGQDILHFKKHKLAPNLV